MFLKKLTILLGTIAFLLIFLGVKSAFALRSSDVNGDGRVNALDVKLILLSWLSPSGGNTDIDENSKTNSLDVGYVFKDFGQSLPTPTASLVSSTDWPQLAHDAAHTSFNPVKLTFPSPGSKPFKWRWLNGTEQTPQLSYSSLTAIPDGYSLPFSLQPIIAENKVFIANHLGEVYALPLNYNSNQPLSVLWKSTNNGRGGNIGGVQQTLAYDSGLVFVPSTDHYLYALNATNGQLVWSFKTLGSVTSPTVENHLIYFGSADGNLYCLELSGKEKWRFKAGGPVIAPPAVSLGKVFFGAEDMYAYALNSENGSLSWKTQLRGSSFKNTWPVVSIQNNLVIFRTNFQFKNAEWDLWRDVGPLLKYTADNNLNSSQEKNILLNGANLSYNCGGGIFPGLEKSPDYKTFFALNVNNGSERFTAPIIYFGADGGAPPMPVVDSRNGDIYAYYWTFGPNKTMKQAQAYGAPDCGGNYSPNPDIAKINPLTGERIPLGFSLNTESIIQLDNVPWVSLAIDSDNINSANLVFVASYQWTGGYALVKNQSNPRWINLWYPTSSNACCSDPRYYSWYDSERDSNGYENLVPAKRRQIYGYAGPSIGPGGEVLISDWGGMLTAIQGK